MNHSVRQLLDNLKYNLKDDFSPFVSLIMLPTVVIEITLVCVAYKMRVRIASALSEQREFENCQQSVHFINVIACGGMILYPSAVPHYQNSFTSLLLAVTRLIAALIATPFLMLFRRNELTVIDYFQRRFKSTFFTQLYIVVCVAWIYLVLNSSIYRLHSVISVFGSDPLTCITLILVYSSFTTALGGLRGFIWIGAVRFYLTLALLTAIMIAVSVKIPLPLARSAEDLAIGLKGNALTASHFTTYFLYYLVCHFNVIISKYVNAVSKDSHAWWSSYLLVIPHTLINALMDGSHSIAHLHYKMRACDPVGSGAVSRPMIFYQFLSEIMGNAIAFQIMFGLCEYLVGSFAILDCLMTFWYLMSSLIQRFDWGDSKASVRSSRYHFIVLSTSAFAGYYAFMLSLTEDSFFWWLSSFTSSIAITTSLFFLSIIVAAALFPQMSALTLWLAPIELTIIFFITIYGKFDYYGVDSHALCTFKSENCSTKCRYPCMTLRSQSSILLSFIFLIAAFLLTVLISFYSKKTYRNLDQDLYMKSAIKFWTRRYLRAKKKPQPKQKWAAGGKRKF